jgi:hypothetical protein
LLALELLDGGTLGNIVDDLMLVIPGGTLRLVFSLAFNGAFNVAVLDQGSVAELHGDVVCNLSKIIFTNKLLYAFDNTGTPRYSRF